MTEDEITARLQAGGLKLAFDTNAVEDDPRTSRLRNKVEQWNATLASRKLARVRLIACALVHHEKVFHLKQEWGDKFNPNIIVKALKARGWQIDPYYRPAREVGGDFYDFPELEAGRVGVVVGDATSKRHSAP